MTTKRNISSHRVSPLGKTWIFDLDGTLVKHNGYKLDGKDTWLPGAKEFLNKIPDKDKIIIITSREEKQRGMTEAFLSENGVHVDSIIYNAPYGERILVNDAKPSGLQTAVAVNTERDIFMDDIFFIDRCL